MAFAQTANLAEKLLPWGQQPISTDVANYSAEQHGDQSQLMKALAWQGKASVKMGKPPIHRIQDCLIVPRYMSMQSDY